MSHPGRRVSGMAEFELVSDFEAAGDQPKAIAQLAEGVEAGERYQTLLGITGSGKSFTIAGLIAEVQRPTLILAPNKSLAAQLASEFREFFPHNRVEYFVSYYDYYQPEAYIPSSDTFIEKDSSINDEIDRLRHSATSALLSRRDVVIIASVSAIYGLGSPETYATQLLTLNVGEEHDQRAILKRLVELQYERNDMAFVRNKFRVRGDTIEIFPAYEERGIRVQLFGDEIERISWVDPVTGELVEDNDTLVLFPASHYVTQEESLRRAVEDIEVELIDRLKWLEDRDKLLEAQRLRMRTTYDLEMMREGGSCAGSRTTRATSTVGPRARRRTRSSTTSRRTSSSSSTRATSPCPSSTASTRVTGRARTRSSSTASGSRARWTTGRCGSRSSAN